MLVEYRIAMPKEQIALMERVMQDMAEKYHNVHVLDYQSWGKDDDFYNATHLNTAGAELFTTMLMGAIQTND